MEDRLKILVVDDDPLIRELIQVYLEEEFMVIHAENGLQAIEKVQTDKPSLVLLDKCYQYKMVGKFANR